MPNHMTITGLTVLLSTGIIGEIFMWFQSVLIAIICASPYVSNEKVEKTQATVELPKENLPKLNEVGTILGVQTVVTDKYPAPALAFKSVEFPADGTGVYLELQGDIPKEVISVYTDWTIYGVKFTVDKNSITGFNWNQIKPHIWPDGKSAFVGQGVENTTWKAIVYVTYVYQDGTNITVTKGIVDSDIKIGTGNPFNIPTPIPTPVPTPTPNPTPTPTPVPADKYGITKITMDSAQRVGLRKDVALILADSYGDFIKAVNGGLVGKEDLADADLAAVLKSLKTYNLNALNKATIEEKDYIAFTKGAAKTKDDPQFPGDVLFDLYNKGEFKKISNLVIAAGEIQNGLITYAKSTKN